MDNHTARADLLARDQAHLIHPLHDAAACREGHVWVRGEGCVLTDADGKRYLDGISGLWNVLAGYGRRELVQAAAEQMETLPYCSGYAGSTNPRAIELGERLAEAIYPSINHFFFTTGGAEASETTFKLARYYWKRRGRGGKFKVISLQWSYHGVTLAAMSATGMSHYWPMFEPRTPGFLHISSPYPYRYEAPPGVNPGLAAANELEEAIQREGPETVALFFAEPVQGAGGVIVPPDDYFPRIREICDQYDVLLAADEVITGFGRTGKWFALEHWGVQPDIVQFAKGITSGYFPLGGVGVSDRLAEVFEGGEQAFLHAHTYSAHPVACAVASRNIQILQEEDFPGQAAEKGAYLLEKLEAAVGGHPHVGDLRGKGLMCALELVQDKATKAEFPAEEAMGRRLHAETQKRGLFTRIRGDVFCLAPPVVISLEQLDQMVDIVAESVEALFS